MCVITTLNPAIVAAIERDPTIDWEIAVEEGILLVEVAANSPADRAGLQPGDVMISLGGAETLVDMDFIRVLHSSEVGEPLEIEFWRGDELHYTTIIPIESPRT